MTDTSASEREHPGTESAPSPCQACVLGRAAWPDRCPFREIRHPEQTVLIQQGQRAATVWFVKEGLVALSSVDSAGGELGCSVRGAGSLVGLEVLLGRPSPFTAWALTDVLVCSAGADKVAGWAGNLESPIGALLRLGIEEASRRTLEQLALGGTSAARVARFLLQRCVDGEKARPLDVSQRVMARMLAMTPETLSRTLGRLRSRGAISSTRPVIVSDPSVLRSVAADEKP